MKFKNFKPILFNQKSIFKKHSNNSELISIDRSVESIFSFNGISIDHNYCYPDNSDILNCGGYLDKLSKYRSNEIEEYFWKEGISTLSFSSGKFPILKSRSPQLDLLVLKVINFLLDQNDKHRVRILDMGCTVCEHFDLLDLMMKVSSKNKYTGKNNLFYHGVDISPLVIAAAKIFHSELPDDCLKLEINEGSSINFKKNSYSISLCVGVMHNLKNPVEGTINLISASSDACILALWVCDNETGIWVTSHHASSFYLFGRNDLRQLKKMFPEKNFFADSFIPEKFSTQQNHFVGIKDEDVKNIGCYHLVITNKTNLFSDLDRLEL